MVKVKVIEHSGQEHVTEVESFNALEVYKSIQEAQSSTNGQHVIVVGDVIVDARSIRTVSKVIEPDSSTTETAL
jgi:pyrimidine operon attenuation protein/uracil phosphoribosyltransferase